MTWLLTLWGKAKFYALAAGAAVAAVAVAYWRVREDGKNAARLEQERARADAMRQRKDVDDDVSQMGSTDLDREYDKWLRDNQ